jgi:hypothetical protein
MSLQTSTYARCADQTGNSSSLIWGDDLPLLACQNLINLLYCPSSLLKLGSTSAHPCEEGVLLHCI